MAVEELLRKIRELEEGQPELSSGRWPSSCRSTGARNPPPPPPPHHAACRCSSCRRVVPSSRSRSRRRRGCSVWAASGSPTGNTSGPSTRRGRPCISLPLGKLLYWNRYAEHMYGYSTSEAVGHDAVDLLVHPDDVEAANNIIGNIFMGKSGEGSFQLKTSRVRSWIKTAQNINERYGSGYESQYSEHDTKEEMASGGTSTPSGDVQRGAFVAAENSPGTSKTSSDDSGEAKGLHKMFSSKAEALLTKNVLSWPWRGLEHCGPSKSHVISQQFHDTQENEQTHQAVPEPIIIPELQETKCAQLSKYEVKGYWWSFNNNSTSSSTVSTNSSAIERVDLEQIA